MPGVSKRCVPFVARPLAAKSGKPETEGGNLPNADRTATDDLVIVSLRPV